MATVKTSPEPMALRGVPYDVYLRLRDDPRNRGLRMTYHDGTLEVMSPEFRHEKGARRLSMIVNAYASVLGVDCEGSRSTTFRKGLPGQLTGKGKEPDESFYFTNLTAIRAKNTLDLSVDPPPDLWIEVDNRASSAAKLPLYAALGVSEVWRYRPRRGLLWIGRLKDGAYDQADESHWLPGMTPTLLLKILDEAVTRGEPAWDAWLRRWFAGNTEYFAGRTSGYIPF